jgi:hypothetical protein
LFERDCTVQHRHQKVIELAPARNIHPELRRRLVDCAATLARQCNYKGAGTVEFLVRGDLESPETEFVFMEVNPRVQVEHTGKNDLSEYQTLLHYIIRASLPSFVIISSFSNRRGYRNRYCSSTAIDCWWQIVRRLGPCTGKYQTATTFLTG